MTKKGESSDEEGDGEDMEGDSYLTPQSQTSKGKSGFPRQDENHREGDQAESKKALAQEEYVKGHEDQIRDYVYHIDALQRQNEELHRAVQQEREENRRREVEREKEMEFFRNQFRDMEKTQEEVRRAKKEKEVERRRGRERNNLERG